MFDICLVCLDNDDCYKCKNCYYPVCKPCNEKYYKHTMFNIKCMNCTMLFDKKEYKYIISKDYIKKHHLKDNKFIKMINIYKQYRLKRKQEKILIRQQKESIRKLEEILSYNTYAFKNIRNCPHCNVPFQKDGGCDEMNCKVCKKSFKYFDSVYNINTQEINEQYKNVYYMNM